MSNVDRILSMANLFYRLAAEELPTAPPEPKLQPKENYLLYQNYLDSNPEALKKYLDDQKRRQQKRRDTMTPEQREAHREARRKLDMERINQARQSGGLDGKLLLFGRQLASKKNDDRKWKRLDKSIDDLVAMNGIRKRAEELVLYGVPDAINYLIKLIADAKALHATVAPKYAALGKSLGEIIALLGNHLDLLKSQGTVTQ